MPSASASISDILCHYGAIIVVILHRASQCCLLQKSVARRLYRDSANKYPIINPRRPFTHRVQYVNPMTCCHVIDRCRTITIKSASPQHSHSCAPPHQQWFRRGKTGIEMISKDSDATTTLLPQWVTIRSSLFTATQPVFRQAQHQMLVFCSYCQLISRYGRPRGPSGSSRRSRHPPGQA